MLRPPRRLPRRLNRPVTPMTRRLLKKRGGMGNINRWKNLLNRIQRKGQRKMRGWLRSCLLGMMVVLFLLMFIGFGLIVFSPIVQVREIKITRYEARLDKEEIQKILAPFFGRHLFFLPMHEVSEVLRASINDIKSLRLYKKYPSMLGVEIRLDPLFARLVILDPDAVGAETSTGTGIDFLTGKGAYASAPLSEDDRSFPLVAVTDWSVRPAGGDILVTSDFLAHMNGAEKSLKEQFGHEITVRTIFLRAQEYHLRIDRGIEIWFDTASEVDEQMLRYRIFLKGVGLDNASEYVDLRVSDRVIYK